MNCSKAFLFLVFSIFICTSCQSISEAQSSADSKSGNIENQNKAEMKSETPEQKAVRLAEEFIKRNGYTSEPADKDNLSYESIERSANVDELLESRKNSLEPKAYAVSSYGKGEQKGWTVAFRYNKNYLDEVYQKDSIDNYKSLGRAVTMNENFENLRVEHKSIFLNKLEKKLQ